MRALTPFRRTVRVVTADWHDRAWQPRITCGAPVSDPARWRSVVRSSESVFPCDFPPSVCAGPEAGVPRAISLRGGFLQDHRRILFPTL